MTAGEYDEGPKIDIGQDADESGFIQPPSPDLPNTPLGGGADAIGAGKGGGRVLPIVSLILALAALALGLFSLAGRPEPQPAPPMSADAVPGGAGERVAKLEKDMSQLILRMVTLEKELQSVAGKTGSITRLTELNAKVAALQDRLDAMILEKRMASLAAGKPAKLKTPAKKAPALKQQPQKKAKHPGQKASKPPAKKKMVYKVRRGDTLFTIAQRYKVSMSSLKKWNNLKRNHMLKAGEKLVIYK